MANGDGAPVLFTQDTDTGEYTEYTPPSFHETLPEDVRDSEHIKDVSDHAQLAKNYVDLITNQPVLPPDASGYSFEFPEDFQLDEEVFETFKGKAFEMGLTQKTFSDVLSFEVEREATARQSMEASVLKTREETESTLKTEWGDNYDKNVESAKKVLSAVGDDTFMQFLEDSKLGDNPHIIRAFAALGEKMSEGSFIKPGHRSEPNEKERGEGGTPMLSFPSMEGKT
jgi:hypothetical protein